MCPFSKIANKLKSLHPIEELMLICSAPALHFRCFQLQLLAQNLLIIRHNLM